MLKLLVYETMVECGVCLVDELPSKGTDIVEFLDSHRIKEIVTSPDVMNVNLGLIVRCLECSEVWHASSSGYRIEEIKKIELHTIDDELIPLFAE